MSNPETGIVESWLWKLLSLFERGKVAKATADVIHEGIVNSFLTKKVPVSNIMACSFDGCATMTGQYNGLKALLETDIPSIVTIRCPAHSTHLVMKHSLNELPQEIINLVKDINTLLNSAQKSFDFQELQKELFTFSQAMLKLSSTRWLSLESCINRIKKLWDALLIFIEKLFLEKGEDKVKKLFILVSKCDTKCYVLLLSKVLGDLNNLNVFFQRDDVVIHMAAEKIKNTFKIIAKYIFKEDYVEATDMMAIDLLDEKQYKRYEDYDFCEELQHLLREQVSEIEHFCKVAFNFTLSILLYLRQFLQDLLQDIFNVVECLCPVHAMSRDYRQKNPNKFEKLLNIYRHLYKEDEEDKVNLIYLWSRLPNIIVPEELLKEEEKPEKFWKFVMDYKTKTGSLLFYNLARFVLWVLQTPHSNADPERRFSLQNYIKNKVRNSVSINTVDGTMKMQQAIKVGGNAQFDASDFMIDMALESQFFESQKKIV